MTTGYTPVIFWQDILRAVIEAPAGAESMETHTEKFPEVQESNKSGLRSNLRCLAAKPICYRTYLARHRTVSNFKF